MAKIVGNNCICFDSISLSETKEVEKLWDGWRQ